MSLLIKRKKTHGSNKVTWIKACLVEEIIPSTNQVQYYQKACVIEMIIDSQMMKNKIMIGDKLKVK